MRRGAQRAARATAAVIALAAGTAAAATTTPAGAHPVPTPGTTGTLSQPVHVGFDSLKLVITLRWRYGDTSARVRTERVRSFPTAATLTITCRGASGCPSRSVPGHGGAAAVHRTLTATGSDLHRLLDNLTKLHFHAGDRVVFTVAQPHAPTVRSEVVIRAGRPPMARRLP